MADSRRNCGAHRRLLRYSPSVESKSTAHEDRTLCCRLEDGELIHVSPEGRALNDALAVKEGKGGR